MNIPGEVNDENWTFKLKNFKKINKESKVFSRLF